MTCPVPTQFCGRQVRDIIMTQGITFTFNKCAYFCVKMIFRKYLLIEIWFQNLFTEVSIRFRVPLYLGHATPKKCFVLFTFF